MFLCSLNLATYRPVKFGAIVITQFRRKKMIYIAWIIFGALAGWIASIITGRNRKMGAIANIVVGIIGAFIGGALMNFLGIEGISGFSLGSLAVAIAGSVILIVLAGLIRR